MTRFEALLNLAAKARALRRAIGSDYRTAQAEWNQALAILRAIDNPKEA